MRYRYRIEPTPAQQQMLARAFGCCRVVFNDALRVREEAYRGSVQLSDSEVQRRVITQAKRTSERGWLAEVPSVALVQSVNDSHRASGIPPRHRRPSSRVAAVVKAVDPPPTD